MTMEVGNRKNVPEFDFQRRVDSDPQKTLEVMCQRFALGEAQPVARSNWQSSSDCWRRKNLANRYGKLAEDLDVFRPGVTSPPIAQVVEQKDSP